MNDIEKNVLTKINCALGALKLKYAIVDSGGVVHGDLKVVVPKKRVASIYGYGVMIKHIKPHFANFPDNTSKTIPAGQYDAEIVRRSVCNMATKEFGAGNYKTTLTGDKKGVVITRLNKDVADLLKDNALDDMFALEEIEVPQRQSRLPRMFR